MPQTFPLQNCNEKHNHTVFLFVAEPQNIPPQRFFRLHVLQYLLSEVQPFTVTLWASEIKTWPHHEKSNYIFFSIHTLHFGNVNLSLRRPCASLTATELSIWLVCHTMEKNYWGLLMLIFFLWNVNIDQSSVSYLSSFPHRPSLMVIILVF